MAEATKRYAIVTGANKGIGLEICRQLACTNEVIVVLTSRDEIKGLQAVEMLHKQCALSDRHLLFHQLDVMNPQSIASLADFVNTHFGKLDILVNNAGIGGATVDAEALRASQSGQQEGGKINWSEIITETYELAEECIQTNYYGARRMVEAFISLLQSSDSPRIINVSSSMGKLKNVKDERAKQVLSDAENLSEERVDELVAKFLRDFKEGEGKTGWAANMSAYIVSKAAMNAYTRIVAKKYPSIYVNSVCPGYVKTDINHNTGFLTVQEGAESPVRLALLPDGGPSGLFFDKKEASTFD